MLMAARLRRRITIQQRDTAQDPSGEPVFTWSDLATVWASIEPSEGREAFSANQRFAEQMTRFRCRYNSVIAGTTHPMRISWNNRLFNIESITNRWERNAEIRFLCTEINESG